MRVCILPGLGATVVRCGSLEGAGVADPVQVNRVANGRRRVARVTQKRRRVPQVRDDCHVQAEDDRERHDAVGRQLDVLERTEHELGRNPARLTRLGPDQRPVLVPHCMFTSTAQSPISRKISKPCSRLSTVCG